MFSRSKAEGLVGRKAAELAELAVRGRPPFDAVARYSVLNQYKKYFDRYDEATRREVTDAYVSNAQFLVGGETYRNDEALGRVREFEKPIADDLRRNFVPVDSERRLARGRFAVRDRRKLVEDLFLQKLPEYRQDSSLVPESIPQGLFFSKALGAGNKMFVGFDLGSGKTDGIFNSYIGIEKPFYSVQPTSFFVSPIRGIYYTPDELRAIVVDTLELLDVLLPVFGKKMEEALRLSETG